MKFAAAVLSTLPLLALAVPAASPDTDVLALFKKTTMEGLENLFKRGLQESGLEARQAGSSTHNELEQSRGALCPRYHRERQCRNHSFRPAVP